MERLEYPVYRERVNSYMLRETRKVVDNFNELFERLEAVISRLEDIAKQAGDADV